jgi:sialidase-1
MRARTILLLSLIICACAWVRRQDNDHATARNNVPFFEQIDVYLAGQDGVHTYRIPSLLFTKKGTLLAFCEARKQSIADNSPTDLVLKRSFDNGCTWQPKQIVWAGQGTDAVMNPTAVIDQSDGTIILVCATFQKALQQQVLVIKSRDDGATWSAPTDIRSIFQNHFSPFVPGPGTGIQLKSGRLVIPGYTCLSENAIVDGHAMVIYSDDHGRSWRPSMHVSEPSDESQVIERQDGTLLLNMRSNRFMSCRAIAVSQDGGETWGVPYDEKQLNEVPCQASFIRFPGHLSQKTPRLLFSNPNVSGKDYGAVERTRMTVRMSYDEGKTWPVAKLVHEGPSSYSSLAVSNSGMILCMYEGGLKHRREWLRLARFNLAWLTDGKDTLTGK